MPVPLTISLIAYNEEEHMAETIRSILNQTFTNFIFRIYNHGSIDSTGDIADSFKRLDHRIQVFHVPVNEGAKFFHSVVIPDVDTPFFMFVAGHDLYDRRFIETCIRPLEEDLQVVLSYTRAAFFRGDQATSVIMGHFDTRGMDPMSRSLVVGYALLYAYQCSGIYRTEELKAVKGHTVAGSDHVMLAELALRGTFAESPEILFFMRQREDFGDQEAYKRKHLVTTEEYCGISQYLRTMQAYMQIAETVKDDIDRDLFKLAFYTQCLLRNRNILEMYGESVRSLFSKPGFSDALMVIRKFISLNEDMLLPLHIQKLNPKGRTEGA